MSCSGACLLWAVLKAEYKQAVLTGGLLLRRGISCLLLAFETGHFSWLTSLSKVVVLMKCCDFLVPPSVGVSIYRTVGLGALQGRRDPKS